MVGLRDLEDARSYVVEDFFFPEDRALIQEKFFPSVLKEGHGEIEIRFRHFQTGEPLWFVYKVLVLTDSDGKVIGYATVSQNVTQRRELEDHLRKLAADLSEASRRKDEFLATLAHELRNPLAPIRNGVQVLRLAADSATAEDARVMIERQVDQMVRLIDDLLDVSRITLGKFELRRERAKLSDVIESAVESSRPLIDYMGHTLTISLPDTPVCVYADPTRLAQICSNLLNNSAKYTERGGHIWLTAAVDGSNVTVSVKDTGIGIAPDHLPRIFEMFSQVEGSLERSQGGLGIGLTLVKRLVEMHQGTVEARSQGPGTGAEFVVQMPIVVADQGTDSTARNGQTDAFKSALRILIVDDNQDAANSLALLLRLMGNDTRTAYDGEEGVRLAKEIRPEIVLLDIGLPKLNGYEVCQRIREEPWGKDVVLIAVTGWGQEQDRRRSESVGFDGHLTKPIVPEQLMDLLADRHKSVEVH
jgi:signal transduction histidine kinase/ActR/RegA family two-component response regulator